MPSAAQSTCGLCGSTVSKRQRQAHKDFFHPQCRLCHARFDRQEGLRSHQSQAVHCFCPGCNLSFSDPVEHIVHARAAKHGAQYSCCDCNHDYPTAEYLQKHCCKCDMVYQSPERLKKHFQKCPSHRPRLRVLRVKPQASSQHKCEKCGGSFASKKSLNKHQRTHKAPRIIPCPTETRCGKKFPTPSALINHLESGRCPSGMTRTKLNGMVIAHDHQGQLVDHTAVEALEYKDAGSVAIAAPEHLEEAEIESCRSEDSFDGPAILTPSASEASDDWMQACMGRAWETRAGSSGWDATGVNNDSESNTNKKNDSSDGRNSIIYRPRKCPLCLDRPAFRSAAAFQAHVNSAVHAPRVFHCPLPLAKELALSGKPTRIKSFSTLSGLAQHLEAGACYGGLFSFRRAVKYVESQLAQLGLGHVRLLADEKA